MEKQTTLATALAALKDNLATVTREVRLLNIYHTDEGELHAHVASLGELKKLIGERGKIQTLRKGDDSSPLPYMASAMYQGVKFYTYVQEVEING